MFFVDGNRSYLAGGAHSAAVVGPPRDIDEVIAAATGLPVVRR
ncbi:hypothetical protein GCM10010271_46650 [Streptomyces kurssanovii]|nr:hypothetical protein GCM10010271_46650 [Streptomyces kurssanovii]